MKTNSKGMHIEIGIQGLSLLKNKDLYQKKYFLMQKSYCLKVKSIFLRNNKFIKVTIDKKSN